MPAEAALGPIYTVLKALMAADATLVGLLAEKPPLPAPGGGPAIYDDGFAPQPAPMPYVVIGAGTQIPFHTMGPHGTPKYGWNCTLQVKPVGATSQEKGMALVTAVIAVLRPGLALVVPGYQSGWIDDVIVQPTLIQVEAGKKLFAWPTILRVYVHD